MQQWTHVCLNRPILSGMTRKFTTKLNFGRKKAGKDATAAMDKLRSLEKRQDGWIQEPQLLMFQMTWFLAGETQFSAGYSKVSYAPDSSIVKVNCPQAEV